MAVGPLQNSFAATERPPSKLEQALAFRTPPASPVSAYRRPTPSPGAQQHDPGTLGRRHCSVPPRLVFVLVALKKTTREFKRTTRARSETTMAPPPMLLQLDKENDSLRLFLKKHKTPVAGRLASARPTSPSVRDLPSRAASPRSKPIEAPATVPEPLPFALSSPSAESPPEVPAPAPAKGLRQSPRRSTPPRQQQSYEKVVIKFSESTKAPEQPPISAAPPPLAWVEEKLSSIYVATPEAKPLAAPILPCEISLPPAAAPTPPLAAAKPNAAVQPLPTDPQHFDAAWLLRRAEATMQSRVPKTPPQLTAVTTDLLKIVRSLADTQEWLRGHEVAEVAAAAAATAERPRLVRFSSFDGSHIAPPTWGEPAEATDESSVRHAALRRLHECIEMQAAAHPITLEP